MRRYWGNFARNGMSHTVCIAEHRCIGLMFLLGDPNDDTGAVWPKGLYDNDKFVHWDPFNKNRGQLVLQSNDNNPEHEGRVVEMNNNFKQEICDHWDEMDVYLKIQTDCIQYTVYYYSNKCVLSPYHMN